ncbi:helicase-related protein [uncultured Prevotella sp.]|uniref:MuF-C-terminal domain-containing protein n=1 Tax=uncultured Prevotella sp. TaxID=159272 RepID=UPI002605082F|nr:helicase-related protein [uncultured Prevotella sp.]
MAQVNDNDDIKWLYGKLKSKGYNIGSEAEFKSSLANGEDRKWYYEKAKGMGLNMGSMDDFESMYAPKAAPAPKKETPSSGQQKPASAVSASPEQPKQQKPKGTPMTEQDKIRMSLQMGQMKQQVQQGIANTNAKIGRMMEPLTQKGRERRRLGEFQARMAGTPTHVVGFNTASPAPAGSGARGGSQQKPVQSEQSPQPYGVKYENGKAKTQWVLPDGTLTTSLIEANQAEYEARTARLAHQFQDRMKENGLDPNKPEDVRKQAQLDYEAPMRKAIEDEWQRAETEDRAADEAYRKDMERAEGGGFWDRLKKSITPLGPDGMPLRRGDETLRDIKRAAKRQDTFNLEKMAQSVLQNMPQEYKDNQILNYSRYFREHPSELKGRTVSQAAKEALQGEVYHATYERAVQARMPKSKTEFLLRKVADQPFFSQTMADNMAARLFSHSIGTEAADMDAMGRYGTDHRALDITGTVLNMAIDPTTYISGGVGSFAGKQALKLSGKVALKGASKEAAERYVGRTLAGRMVAGVAAGSANFGTFEGLKNMQQQMRLGGTLNPETGEYEFSAGDMLKATGHGMLLGSVTGTLSPVLGNVSDKLVKATESTAGKVGIRAGELMTSTVAEGTIFATPEWIENAQLADDDPRKRKAMDIWTDNMAMMIGFKVSHGIKSAPQVIAGLRPIAEPKTMEERNHNRRSFAERLRKRMDASPRDLDFTKEERDELKRNGYGDLASLFTRTPKQPTKPKAKPTMTDGKIMTFDVDFQHAEAERVSNPEFDGYEAMERLMQDPNVSQSARAKAYYILTGRMLPMGTITGYTTNKDANGVTVQAMTAQGEVVTSRHFKNEEEAKKEEANIMRQAELNSVDVGERYKEAAANAKVVQAAVESVAPGADFSTVMRNYKAVKDGDKDAIAAYGKMVEDIDRAIEANKSMADGERPEAIRASIKEETGVDVDATLRKEPKNRTEEEQAAVEDYIKRLFPEQKSEEAGAGAEAEQPMSEAESAAAAAYDQARLLWDKVEKGDADAKAEVDAITLRMQEAYQMCEDAFGADAEMRIAEINEDPWPLVNNPELSEDQQDAVLYYVNAKAAMEGVMDASNEAADGKRKEVEANVERHTHKDMGVVQPATMKVDDKPVYVVKGNVVMLPDGSGIDVRNSDQSIVICDAETGEYKFASPDQLFSLGEAIDPQTELDEAYANIQAEHEAVLGVPENGENVQKNGENEPNSTESVPQLTDDQLQQYAQSAFNEATQSNGITIPQEQAEQLQQHNQQMLEQEQQRKEEEANRQPTALERVPINEETGEPMFEKADRETALDALNEVTGGNDENTTAIVRAQVEQATKALEALKKKEPTKKAPSLKGSPMAMVKAQQEAEANYNTAMEEYNAQVAAAEENLNAWSRINSLMNDRKRAIREQQEAERKVREEKLHAEAVARLEEDKRIAAEKAAEQKAVGTHAVNPKIKAKWDGSTKVEGNPNAITLADGSTIRGHYVLTEAGAATASHDVNNAYEPTEGFPIDENGESVNDRDYKRDRDAQRIVRDMADSYDSRALQTPVIVSKDGVVLSGNNRTMSGEIAAKNGTDKAYVDYLREFGAMFGFTPEQIDGMQHPRVVFVPDEELPYDASTFARFNAEQQKKQSKPEHAVKLGKIVPDNVFTSITNDISRFDRMSDYYADDKSVASAISQLLDAGVINEMQLPELRTGNALSAAGKELIENTLIGKVFQTSPDAVRQIISTPTLRQSVVMGLNEIANNRTLAKSGYDLSKELAAAVDLVSRAKSDSPEIYKEGMPVSPYGRQQGLFDDEYGDSRVTDGVTLLLADLLNSGKPSDLRKVLSTYNNEAASPAAGQIDMFSGDVTSKEEILKNVNEYFRNATPKEQQALIDAAVAERKRRAEASEPAGGDEASEQATVVAGSDAEPQQPVVASEEPVKGNKPDADALAKEAEEKLSERITDTEDEWTEPSEYGEIYKHRMFVDGKEVIKVDAPDKSKNYPGTYYEIDGKQFGDLYEVANYIDGNEQPLSAKIEAASAEVNTDPTEAQKEAGNYKKGHVQVGTFDITIEQPQGSVRKGTDADGKQWESKMNNTYGYIRGAVGVDGDHIDVFLSNDIDGWNGRKVYVVDQYNPDGSFDEHKVMLGFNDMDEAKSDYLANYEQGWENGRRIDITGVNLEDFEKWIESSKRKTKPFGEYSSVKKDVVEINTPEEAGYSITPSTYTNKKGKTSDVSLLTFDHDLTADQERAVKEFAKERTGEGRFAPARGWKDRESGGWMFRSEEDARKAAEMVDNEQTVADNQPMTAQELRDAVEPKKPTASKKTAAKKPANRIESVPTEEPIEPEKPKYEVSDEEMNGLMNDIRDILGIGDDEGDAGFKFRDPDELTAEQRQKLMSVGQRLAMAMVERGNESFGNYASMMVKALGDKVRPWLKAFYGGLEYVPGYDKYALTPYEEVKAFDVENFDKPNKDVMAQANMIVEEGKAQVAAEKANKELKATRNEQRKETEKQTAANTDAVAAEAKSVASEATALAETSSDEQALAGAAERVDETLNKVNEQLALLGYYEADEVEKDYNEAYGYMRNAEKKAVKDAADLASQLIFDLNLSHYEASHSKQTDKKGNRKKKPLAVSNISPIGGDVSIHLPLEEGRELYLTIGVEPRAAKGVEGFGGSDLEVTHIMFRVDHPEGTGNDRYGRNVFVDSDVTYSDLLKQVQREAYKYLIGSGVTNEGEYAAGDKVQYSTDGGRTWTDAVVVQPNDVGGIRIDTGLAPVMWVNAHPDQLRHKPSESAEPKHEAVGDFYEDGINEEAVAALPEDTAIQLHVVDILNPGMTDHSMKSKIESLKTLLPKISDKKLSELDKEYGDDKDMGTHIKAEVARRAKDGGIQPTSSEKAADKPKPASKKKATKKVKPEQPVGDLFAGLFDNTSDNGLQGNDEAVRTETVPADNSGQQQGLRESQGSPRKTAAQEGGRPDGGRGGQSTGKDRAVSAGLHGLTEPKNTRNNHSERGADHAPTSVNGRIEANIKAIELAHELLESGETATPEQMSVLRQFSGWGGLGAAFSDGGYDWKQRERNKKIRELLGEEAYEQAVMSANSAYYTPAYVVDTLWDIANQLGFKGGSILEGSAGIGNILGQMPTTVCERSNIHAIEIDGTSGGILSLLYPDAKVEIQGFEQTRIPNGSVDLAITNMPFVTGLRVNDTTGDGDLSKKFHNIHDFCIAKNVRKLREGGLGIFISSNGTLDNSKALRDWVVNEGGSDFIGAFRMNNKTFGGTTVTSDIIVIRKRVNGQKSAQAIDVSSISGERTAEYEEPGARKAKQLSMDYNKYFIEHPDHMAGEMRFAFEEGDTFRPTSKGLYPVSGKDQGKMLVDFVKSFTEEDSSKATSTDHHDVSLVLDASADGKKLGEMYMKDGQIVLASFGGYYPLEVNDKKIKGHTKQECFTAYAAIKSALAEVMQYQTENESDAGLKPLIAKLNKAYDAFVNTYGNFNKNNQLAWLRNDVDYPNVFSLETYKEQGDGKGGVVKTYDKADVMKGRVVEKESEPHPENVKDGVVVSMFKNGRIDVPYIASQLGKSEAEVKREIIDSGLGFEDPTTRQMEVSYQYLSGNVREKLKQAEANNENGEYSKNIKALQDVVPMNIPAHLIDFTLGSSWLDPKLYDEYVKERTDIDVHFTAAGGTWFMKAPTYGVNVEKNRAMGIVSEMLKKTIMGHELISAAIQNKSIIVSRTEKHYDGTTETITDREATAACAAKIDEIRQDFKDWARGKMQSDADLSARMEQEYNDRFNNYVPMSIPDDFVPEYFGGATHKFKMRSHQGKAIVRGTMQPLLLAHEVGTGKTFTLISTAMEMRRLGTARKPMIVVQNATVGQFAASAKELYPNAKILTLEDNDRNAEGRKNFYAKIKYNDWDMIVVPQSTFEFIPDSDERQMQFVQDKIDEKMLVLEQMREADSSGRDPITRRAEKELADLQAEMAALSEGISKKRTANNEKKKAVAKQNAAVKAQEMLDRRTDDVENFDDMGIDALLIDEAHEYKHLGFATAMQRGVKGVDPSYSKKSQGVYLKTQAILEKNNGRNVIFATGTPISNTAAEIWTFMRYLMPKDTMKEYGIYYFDDFVRNFGNIQQMPEFNTSGKFKEVNRFAGYVNLPELVRIWSGVADTVLTKDQTELVKKIPEMEGGKAQDIYLPQTRALRSVMKYVREELERFDQMSGKEKKENSSIPLTMYGIAQGAAVDARLVEMHAEDDPRSKTNEAVRQTLRSLKETDDYKGTVAIFADHYQNKRSGFNLYEDIKKKLIQQGVPESEVIVMKPGMTIKKKLEIFDKVNRGEVRVILGSTATLGTGVNIQERLHTLIHLDAPNRPMDYTQRNGRILRQGNLHKQWNKPVRVLRFGVEDSLDVTAYQRLKTKGAIADSVMEGDRLMQDSMNNRVLEEEEDVFGDTVAQLSGSEYALLKNNAEKNVHKYESRRKQWEADQTYIHNAKPKLEGQIKAAEQRAEEANAQLLAVQKAFPDGKFTEITVGKLKFASVDAMADFIKEHNKKILDAVKAMKENPGSNVQTNTLTLSLGGYDFVVKTEMSRETVNNGGLLFAEIHRRMSYSCPELGLNNVPVKQSLLRNAVEDITENVITGRDFAERFDIATRMVQHGKSELEQLKQREGKPFEFGKELEEAKRQLEEYSEAMKVEMAEKEKKYAEMDASVEAASDVVTDDEDETAEDKTMFRLLDDDDPKAMELESLPESELVPVFRNVQAFEDDALGSPMAFTDAETGERRTLEGRRWNYSAPPKVELTEEQQRKLDELNKNGYIMVDGKKSTELQINDGLKFVKPKTKEAQLQYFLKKNPEDKGLWAAYDPYDHAIETPLNTQFGEAYKRPNLVVVRSLIPKSELDEPFHADYALLPTGAHQWNNGRTLYLSRWSKIDKVLTREEEAKLIDEYWKKHPGKREELKTHRDYNRFVPQVRRELEKMGYRFELDGKELTPEESLALDKQNWESRDVIPGREGHTPFVSNEDIARINAKMAGKWVGEPKEAMETAMTERVTELSERLHTPVRIIRTEEEVAALPSVRQRRMKGSFNPMTGEVTIVVPNNANMADIENTFVHEVVGHDGLRVLFPEEQKLNNALDELYRVSKDEIRGSIDRMAQKMYDAEVDRIREKKRKEHVANGEDANASYYADMATAHAEAGKKREQFKRDATEEYGADLAGRIGEKGFEKMSAEELTFWGKLKAMLQKALQKLLDGLKIPGKRKWSDKDWAFVLHEAYKRKKNGGKPTVFDAADTEVMRRRTGFGDTKFSDGKREQQTANERFNNELTRYQNGEMDKNEMLHLGRPQGVMRTFLPNLPIVMRQRVIKKGSEKKHDVDVSAIMNMPQHLSSPIFVFQRSEDTIGVLTDMRDRNGKNVCVAIELKRQIQQGAEYLEVNDVRSFHGREFKNIVEPIANNKTLKWVDKEKGLAYLSSASQPVQQEIDKQVLDTATKVVKDFVNPKVSDENIADEGIMFRDGDMGLEETITKMKVEASQANADNWQAKQDAMRAIGGNLNKLRQAMARQREYDLSTVKSITDLAKVLLENGLLDDLSKYETKRILSAVNNVHGKQDVSDYVQKVMDIMVDNQLRMGANQLGKLLSIRGSRVDARGIEVQGQLDPEGQRIAQVVRKATSLPKENIEERIADCTNRMGSDDNAVAEEAAIEYSGLLLAHQFVEDITESKAEEKALRESIKEAKADLDAGTMEADAYREYVESTNDAIRQNKIERAEAYRSIVEQVGGVLGGSVERAKAWREAEKQRVETIHHNANSDMTGRPNDEHHKESKAQKIANNSIVRFVLAPLGTFDQMLRMFGKKSVNGEGYLWNRYMRGWVEATEKEYTGYQNALKTLDEKVSDIFGKKMKWGDLFSLERNLPKATVTFWDGGEQKAHELTQGNLLYIYMVDKMADGRMKLRRMGITEEDVENIKEFVDPRFLELADWMQDKFLVEKRNEYNEVHKRMFGASMAAIENYFPLKILANARIEEVDVADDTTDTALPATSTGSIIKRRRNNLALDVMGADAFSVILDHIQQMERWASFAEFNRDLNTLLSYKRFRNQVMNMTSVYGGGKTLWKNFRNVCSMAAGAYRPPIAALDKAAVNVAKGVTAAKVSFRVFTALKQFLSMPAYLSDSSPVYLAGNIANPIGAWKWSMENLPLFEKRWKSRMAGDPRLMKSEMDWKMWQNRAVEIASRIGMSPNAFVDALTVAIGAHSMYQTKKKKYLRYGYDEETAEKRAKQDATILFNQTQQSSESAFLSTMQTDRSWLSVLFTVFRNSSMSYTRQLYDALRNLKHRFEPGYKGLTEEYLAKQMRRDGIDPDKADQNAKSEYRRSLMRDIVRVGVFGYLLQLAWNLGAYLPYLLLGDDKDEKSDMWHDIFCHTMFGSIEGLTGGDVMSAVGNGFAKGEGLNLFSASKDMPLSSDLQNIVSKWNKDKVAAMNDVTNLMVQSGIGVNPQSLTDAVVAIMDYCGDDANTSRECALLITRIINCPQSQIDKIYFDELNATAAEAQGMTPAEIAERYARYKMHRGAPLTGWAYTDETRDSVMTAQQNRVLTKAKEKLNSRMETEETKQLLSDYDAVAKQETALSKIKKTDRAAYREGMKQLRQSNDMRQHMRLKRYKHDMNELTSKYLRCKSAEERDSIVSTMFSTRAKMLEDIGRLKQQ